MRWRCLLVKAAGDLKDLVIERHLDTLNLNDLGLRRFQCALGVADRGDGSDIAVGERIGQPRRFVAAGGFQGGFRLRQLACRWPALFARPFAGFLQIFEALALNRQRGNRR